MLLLHEFILQWTDKKAHLSVTEDIVVHSTRISVLVAYRWKYAHVTYLCSSLTLFLVLRLGVYPSALLWDFPCTVYL